ncbi:MAG: TlpA family protein disulfide reductase [Fibrobacteraceae bacterium]|nr:TlpA family protein disulfide reductase [Fibrobacteraceae bacterium]
MRQITKFALFSSLLLIPLFSVSCQDPAFNKIPEKVEGFQGTTLVVFHASWCGYCIREMPLVKKLYADYSPCGLNIVGVNEDDGKSSMEKFVKSENIPFPVIFWSYELMNQFGNPRAIPANFLLDSAGNVRMRVLGPLREQDVRIEIEKTLGEKAKNCHP